MTTIINPAQPVKTIYSIDYTVRDAAPGNRDRTTLVEAANLGDAIDIAMCDYGATTIHAVYTADGRRLY